MRRPIGADEAVESAHKQPHRNLNHMDAADRLIASSADPISKRTTTLKHSAEEVRCRKSGKLEGATLSDHGYPIISLFFSAPSSFEETKAYDRGVRTVHFRIFRR